MRKAVTLDQPGSPVSTALLFLRAPKIHFDHGSKINFAYAEVFIDQVPAHRVKNTLDPIRLKDLILGIRRSSLPS